MSKEREIIEKIVEIANTEGAIVFEEDWGGNSLTVTISGRGHTHVGVNDERCTMDVLVDQLHALLTKGAGLSFVNLEEQK